MDLGSFTASLNKSLGLPEDDGLHEMTIRGRQEAEFERHKFQQNKFRFDAKTRRREILATLENMLAPVCTKCGSDSVMMCREATNKRRVEESERLRALNGGCSFPIPWQRFSVGDLCQACYVKDVEHQVFQEGRRGRVAGYADNWMTTCPHKNCGQKHRVPIHLLSPKASWLLKSLGRKAFCSVCFEIKDKCDPCGSHRSDPSSAICQDCVSRSLNITMADQNGSTFIRCPYEGCGQGIVDMSNLQRLVGADVITAFEKRRAQSFSSRLKNVLASKSSDDQLAAEWLRSNTRYCPRCWVVVEKNEGCNDMACRCGFHFCYGCGRPHNRCKCAESVGRPLQPVFGEGEVEAWVFCWACNQEGHAAGAERCPVEQQQRERRQRRDRR